MDSKRFASRRALDIAPSGIRKFFDIVATMEDVISLGIGEPDFDTPEPVVAAGVTTLQAEKDVTQVWKLTQPFKGYADPTSFETRISAIVNEQWVRIVEDGVQDLARYGLARPAAEITLTSKRGISRTPQR